MTCHVKMGNAHLTVKTSQDGSALHINSNLKVMRQMIIGMDEAGRGPVMGPMIIAALAVDDDDYLREIRVRDSKCYSPSSRDHVFALLGKKAIFSVETIRADAIDRKRKQINLNQIEVEAFAAALEKLYMKVSQNYMDLLDLVERSTIYVDSCDVNEKRFGHELAGKLAGMCGKKGSARDIQGMISGHIVSEHKADEKYPVVSAASIVAKTYREREIEVIKGKLNSDFGSGYPSDQRTRSFLEEYLREHKTLPPFTRRSWDTARKIEEKVSSSSLDDFF